MSGLEDTPNRKPIPWWRSDEYEGPCLFGLVALTIAILGGICMYVGVSIGQ